MADGRSIISAVVDKNLVRLRTAAADGVRGGINGVFGAAARALQNEFKGFMEGAGSLFSGGLKDAAAAKIEAAAVAGGVAVAAAAGTALGGAKTAAETAADRVAAAAVGAAATGRNFAENAATVTITPVEQTAGPDLVVPVASPASGAAAATVDPDKLSRIGTDPATGEGIAKADKLVSPAVTAMVSPKSDFNSAAPGEQLSALKAAIDGELGSKFNQDTYKNARDYVMGIKPSGMG